MSITVTSLQSGIDQLIYSWQKTGLVSDSRAHKAYTRSGNITEITWGNEGYVLKNNKFASIQEYLDLIKNRQYSALMSNGDFFQISFSLRRKKIIKHRLCWYPCPVYISPDVDEASIEDVILDSISDIKLENFLSKSPIRFDYDSTNHSEGHPEIHMHIIDENCRIPVKTPLCLRKFVNFIFYNFYSGHASLDQINATAKSWPSLDRLTEGQRKRIHLNIS